jgi:hypothetical protein
MRSLTIEVPDEYFEFNQGDEDKAKAMATRSVVAELVRCGQISTGRAAELLGVSRWDIDAILADYQVYTVEWDGNLSA